MRRIQFTLAVLFSVALVTSSYAGQGQAGGGGTSGQPSGSTPPQKSESPAQPAPGPIISPKTAGHVETIEGVLLRIVKDVYVVKDVNGKEVSLTVDKDTKVDGNIAPNDHIVARATALKKQHAESGNWHAESINKR